MNHKGKIRFKLMEKLRGTRGLHFLEEFERTQWWPRERLWEWQDERLRRLVKHTVENVPFYQEYFREKGLKPGDIRGRKDLYKLPVVDKEIISKDYSRFMADNCSNFRPRRNSTAGTTGTPFHYSLDKDAWSVGWACNWRGWGWGKYRIGDKIALLAGTSLFVGNLERGLKKIKTWFYYNLLQNAVPLSAFDITDDRLFQYVGILRKERPLFLRCYAQAGFALAAFCRDNNIEDVSFKAVFSTAEQLFPSQKELIEEQFNCPVFDDYGCYDGNLKAMECEKHDGYHMAMETAIFEFVKEGNPVSEGETGEILATSLYNYSMPFIRYRVGDRGTPSSRICECGRESEIVDKIDGRCNDFILTPDGKKIHSEFFSHIFRNISWVSQFQVKQDTITEIQILIVSTIQIKSDELQDLKAVLRQRLSQMTVTIKFVQSIDSTSAGKRRFIISKLPGKLTGGKPS